jgi:hypothetical protein
MHMCVVDNPQERPRRNAVTLIIKLLIFFGVLGFALAALLIGKEIAATAAFVSAAVIIAMKAGTWSTSNQDPNGPGDAGSAVPPAPKNPTTPAGEVAPAGPVGRKARPGTWLAKIRTTQGLASDAPA